MDKIKSVRHFAVHNCDFATHRYVTDQSEKKEHFQIRCTWNSCTFAFIFRLKLAQIYKTLTGGNTYTRTAHQKSVNLWKIKAWILLGIWIIPIGINFALLHDTKNVDW